MTMLLMFKKKLNAVFDNSSYYDERTTSARGDRLNLADMQLMDYLGSKIARDAWEKLVMFNR